MLCYAGIVVMSLGELHINNLDALIKGGSFVLGSAFAYACFIIIARRHILRAGAMRFTAIAMTSACLAGIAQGIFLAGEELANASPFMLTLGLTLGIASTFIPSVLNNFALGKLEAHQSALYGCTGIVAVMFMGYTILEEPYGIETILGAILVVIGILNISLPTFFSKVIRQRLIPKV